MAPNKTPIVQIVEGVNNTVRIKGGDSVCWACCDCNLTHLHEYRVVDKHGKEVKGAIIILTTTQDKRRTAAFRRRKEVIR